jgi:hypothetical protein
MRERFGEHLILRQAQDEDIGDEHFSTSITIHPHAEPVEA